MSGARLSRADICEETAYLKRVGLSLQLHKDWSIHAAHAPCVRRPGCISNTFKRYGCLGVDLQQEGQPAQQGRQEEPAWVSSRGPSFAQC